MRKKPTWTVTTSTIGSQGHISDDQPNTDITRIRHMSTPPISAQRNFDKENTQRSQRKANIHSMYSDMNNSTSSFHLMEDNADKNTHSAGHVIKAGSHGLNGVQNKEGFTKNVTVQPFSGKGYCLGTRSADNQQNSGNTHDRNINNMGNSFVPRSIQPGLMGGVSNSPVNPEGGKKDSISTDEVQMVVSDTVKSFDYNTDFVDSQNEAEVLKEVCFY